MLQNRLKCFNYFGIEDNIGQVEASRPEKSLHYNYFVRFGATYIVSISDGVEHYVKLSGKKEQGAWYGKS